MTARWRNDIIVDHFLRSDTGHVMQAIDVTRHSRITQQLVPSTIVLSFICCSRFACKNKVAHDFRYNPCIIYNFVTRNWWECRYTWTIDTFLIYLFYFTNNARYSKGLRKLIKQLLCVSSHLICSIPCSVWWILQCMYHALLVLIWCQSIQPICEMTMHTKAWSSSVGLLRYSNW